ncbi:MAG: ATP-binding cassette domain-containing protein [Gammaproteobacteria bacterium]|nr:ATP-binding cassette domain-containing protein [Gammaproteobacteria bacterium]
MSLTIKNLSFFYEQQAILEQLDLSLPAASISAIIGHSGQGKTTLLRCIAGLEKPTNGTIHWQNNLLNTKSKCIPSWKRNMSMVFQDLALWPHIKVKEHLQLILKYNQNREVINPTAIDEILSTFEIEAMSHRYPAQLSQGQQQRLAIARAVISNPALLILDEPFSSLDERMTFKCWNYLLKWQDSVQSSILYVTHDLKHTIEQTSHIFNMENGKLRQQEQ